MFSLQRLALVSLVVFILLTAPLAIGQQVFGSIFGTVTDSTGAAIAGAKVTITDTNKGTKSEVTTDASGNYTKGQLIPDTYKVEVEVKGFQKVVSNGLEVRVDESARYDAALKVGDVATEVEVTAVAPLLQSDRADVAQTLTTKEVNDLPNLGRNAQSYELLNPGTAKIGWQHASDENPQGSVQLIANGLLFDQIGYELDGTTNQDPILGIIIINPTFDSIAELKQANQNFDAEFSYVGAGLISYSTKSGTNSFHGDAFEYLQINTPGFTTFAASPFAGGLPAALYRQNQFGGSIGGPILKNKLFFFGDAQINREAQGASVLTSVPDALNRTGNFSDWLPIGAIIYDPATGNAATGLGRTAFPNNTIPMNRLSSQALAIMQNFPLPNAELTTGDPFLNNYTANGDVNIKGESWDTREDYYLNEKNSIFGRFSQAHFIEQAPGVFGAAAGGVAFGNYAGDSDSTDRSLAIGWTRTISPTLINEFRFGYSRYHVFDVPNGYGTQPATAAGIPGLNLDNTYTSGLPAFTIGNITNNPGYGDSLKPYQLGYSLGVNQCNCPLTQTENNYQFIDNLSKSHGNHTFKFGADIRFATNLRVPSDNHRAGELTFNGTNVGGGILKPGDSPSPGIGLATFLLGDVSGFNRYVSSSTNASERQKRFYWYGQDQWRPTPKLTVSLGMRWEMVFPETVNAAGNGATFDAHNGLIYVFGEGGVSSHGIQSMNWHNLAPRAGIAYQLNPKTVIRAGYGWSYDLGVFGSNFGHNVTQNPPVLANQSVQPPNSFTDVFTLTTGPPTLAPITVGANGTFPLPPGINPKYRPATLTMPTVYQYNIAVQHQLTSRIAVTGAYVGNSQRHGLLGNTGNTTNTNEAMFVPGVSNTNLDRPFYSTLGITNDLSYYCNCANSHYDSFQGTVRINAWQGWTVQGSYTYQRQEGEGFSPYDSNYYFLYDQKDGYGDGGLLPHNQITIAQTYTIPFGRGQKYGSSINRYADLALGGWQISGVMTYYSGFPFSPTLENYPGKPNQGPNNRPNLGTGSPYAGAIGGRQQWFVGCPDAACSSGPYSLPAANSFGTYPFNTLIGPQFIQQDITLAKTFRVTERIGIILRADAFNSFNHTNLGLPNGDVQSATVGQITSLAPGGSMRKMQFSGTIKF